MLQDVHSRKVSIEVDAGVGTGNVVVASVPGTWLYIHELIGDLAAAGTLTIKCGTRIVGEFTLADGQGITLQDEPGEDNRPRFECLPGEDFILDVTGGTFKGSCHYSLRY
jgi:hypothetical protein